MANRFEGGRFGRGNKAALGNHSPKKIYNMKRLMREEISPEDWKAIVRAQVTKAVEESDTNAAKWISDILVGKEIKVKGRIDGGNLDVQTRLRVLFGLVTEVVNDDDSGAGESPVVPSLPEGVDQE